jgi:hypothetical protein
MSLSVQERTTSPNGAHSAEVSKTTVFATPVRENLLKQIFSTKTVEKNGIFPPPIIVSR